VKLTSIPTPYAPALGEPSPLLHPAMTTSPNTRHLAGRNFQLPAMQLWWRQSLSDLVAIRFSKNDTLGIKANKQQNRQSDRAVRT
jgi:hypothetical protein